MSIGKRGEDPVSNSTIELIIGVIVVFALVGFLVLFFFDPDYSEGDVISKAYFEELEDAIGLANSGKLAEIIMFDRGDSDLKFYLVYFGDAPNTKFLVESWADEIINGVTREKSLMTMTLRDFSSAKVGKNIICICYWNDKVNVCKYCYNLDFPAKTILKNPLGKESWIIPEGSVVKIGKIGEGYVFSEE